MTHCLGSSFCLNTVIHQWQRVTPVRENYWTQHKSILRTTASYVDLLPCNIIFQCPVALVNDLVCRSNLGGAVVRKKFIAFECLLANMTPILLWTFHFLSNITKIISKHKISSLRFVMLMFTVSYIYVSFASLTFSESGKLRFEYEDNIKMHLKELGNEDQDWIRLDLISSGGLL